MEQWDFDAWLAALGALGPRRAALLGLAAAQRISGCLNDERFYRYGLLEPGEIEALLDGCWRLVAEGGPLGAAASAQAQVQAQQGGAVRAHSDVDGVEEAPVHISSFGELSDAAAALAPTGAADAGAPDGTSDRNWRIEELAGAVRRLAEASADYVERSMTELFQSYGPLDDYEEFLREGGETARGDADQALRDFVEEAEPEGAVAAHLDALNAVEFAAQACTGGPWDGALRCIQTTAMAGQFARGAAEGPDREIFAQEDDLAALKAAEGEDLRPVAAELRARARRDAASWHGFTVKLELFSD